MSWPTWSAAAPPIPAAAVAASSMQSTLLPSAVNSAPSVLPPGLQYSPEQWAQAQQHNWQQWAQWQQQYQQWHQQYGAEYQKSLTAMHSTMATAQAPLPTLVNTAMAPPLPVESKPPLPPEEPPLNQASVLSSYSSMSTKFPSNVVPPLMTSQPPPVQRQAWEQKRPYAQETEFQKPTLDQWNSQKGISVTPASYNQPPPQTIASKVNAEELSEAEKKFDKEFAAWEAQFQKWKEQNANHPDKTQYREYEKKWESWRNSLLERREQMRKKRLALTSSASGISKTPNFSQPPPVINQQTSSLTTQQSSTQVVDQHSSLPFHQNNDPVSPKKEDTEINTGESFLGAVGTSGSIPGLDLVKDDCKDQDTDYKDVQNKGPDFDAISKGINSILGDQKLLNMLSLVTKHPPPILGTQKTDFTSQPPPSNYLENQYGNMNCPPPTQLPLRDHYNDQSNQSFEDRSNPGEYHQRESVTNFDDQTRSSFTLGPNDPDQIFRHRSQSYRFNEEKFGGGFGIQKSNIQDNSAPKSLMNLNFSAGGPKISQDNYNSGSAMITSDHLTGSRNMYGSNKTENFRQQYRGQDTFNRFGSKYDSSENYSKGNRGNNRFGSGISEKDYFSNENDFYDDSYRGRDNQNLPGGCNPEDDYDNYNEDEDYDKFHSMFNEDGEENQTNFQSDHYNNRMEDTGKHFDNHFYPRESLTSNNGIPPKEQLQEDSTVPVQANIEEIFPENSIYEPAKVIDYDHKSLCQSDIEVTVEPLHMFDYRHKAVNRIPLPQRPIWLSECIKFIREFDPLACRMYERSSIEKHGSKDTPAYDRDGRGRKEYDRDGRMYERDNKKYDTKYERKVDRGKFGDDYDTYGEKDRKRLRLDNSNQRDNKNLDKHSKDNEKLNLKDALEELSDEDMDWEVGEKHKGQSGEGNKSRSSSPILSNPPNPSNTVSEIQLIEDIICQPGRFNRPPRIVIILRGPPGSGKTYLARLIKDKEVENGGSAPRILSLDDYFMVEHEKSVVEDGKNVTVKDLVYEYEAEMEDSYRSSFIKSFKKTITDGYFPFIIVDNVNDKVKYFGEMWSFAKQNGFQVYICQLDLDPVLCTKRNIHNRTEAEIEECIAGWEPTPSHHPTIDATSFLQSNQIKEVEMEVVNEVQVEPIQDESAEPNSMESVSRSGETEPWRNTSKWKGNGSQRAHQNQGRRGYGGQTWRNRGNWKR